MPSDYHVERVFPGAYALTADHLRAFELLLKRQVGSPVQCTLELDFGRRSESNGVDEMLEDSFLHSTRILSITLSADSATLRSFVDFRQSFFRPVSFRLVGSRNEVLALEPQIVSLVESSRRWDAWLIAPFGQNIGFGILVCLSALSALCAIAYGVGVELSGGVPTGRLMLTAAGILAAALGWMLLPSMVFAIGKGQRKWERIQTVFSWLFLTLGSGAAVNWGTAFWNPFSAR